MRKGKVLTIGTVGLILVVVLAALSVGYALWSKTLYINGTVSTGSVDAKWSVMDSYDDEAAGKDVSSILCEVNSADDQVLDVTLSNIYPGITYTCALDLEVEGTIPVHVEFINPPGIAGEACQVNFTGLELGAQLHPGDVIYPSLTVLCNNDLEQNGFPEFIQGSVVLYQWNESSYPPP